MNKELSSFAARLREMISSFVAAEATRLKFPSPAVGFSASIESQPLHVGGYEWNFDSLALELFALQFENNAAYRKICKARDLTPEVVGHLTQIPAVPTGAFKELEFSCIPPEERTAVFHSSGTTEQKPSRHFHNAESLALYETSLSAGFFATIFADCRLPVANCQLLCLSPSPSPMPHSSLVRMFETVRRKLGAPESVFVGRLADDGAWTLNFDAALAALGDRRSAIGNPQLILGTAFSFVHLLDYLTEKSLFLQLPPGSRVMETGGYKNRSRALPKQELHALITERLGVSRENIVCEYGMSELSSQAYDAGNAARVFSFPPWARARIISPETGREVADGETGIIRVFDLANVFSVAAIQTEDLGVRRGDGFELVGRAQLAEPRGCSLMNA
jgi:hypothetical protein